MNLNEAVKIDANFQNSINIALDLKNSDKINSYIPTSTGLDFLNHFLSDITDSNGDHSTMLIAPYGKGKSHSVLVLLSLLMENDYSKYTKFLNKVRELDFELYEKIYSIENKRFFPIIVSNTRGTLNQALMYSLQKSLNNELIEDLAIDNDFFVVLDRIYDWRSNYPKTYQDFLRELKINKCSVNGFIKDIKRFDEKALGLFKKIHKKILSGAEFVTQNSLEVIDYYQKVAEKLVTQYHYDGVYIVFDEFSKFLESREEKTVSNDMKIIQDLAELCNTSKKTNMYFQLILHKPISDYLSVDSKIRNAFKGIEGRVNTYYFSSTLKNSFDLISNVLVKTSKYDEICVKKKEPFEEVKSSISLLPAFFTGFDKEYLENDIIKACYPLHPITTYLLIKINEKVAQNERTLFTFLAKKTPYSLPTLLENREADSLLLPDVVFDYFKNQLLEEKDNISIHKIASNCMSALNKNLSDVEVKFLKTLSLLLIINEKDIMPSNLSVISDALMINIEECEKVFEKFKEKGILVQRYGGQIQFKINMDLNINNSIDNLTHTKFSKINTILELSKIFENRYVYPRTYNINKKITRFYRIEYIREKDFLLLDNFNEYFSNSFSDGLILRVLRGEEDLSNKVFEHLKNINDDLVVVIYPTLYHDYDPMIKKYLSVNSLLNDKTFIEDNSLIVKELEIILDDIKDAMDAYLDEDYSLSSKSNKILCTFNHYELNESKRMISKYRILGNVFENVYYKYPDTINLELLNKHNVRSTYKSARQKVIDKILNNEITFNDLGTSPEDTIVNCIFVETGIFDKSESKELNNVLNIIEEYLLEDNRSFEKLYDTLLHRPFGLRRGVIPLFLAWTISKLKQCVLLSYKEQEVELNAQVIEAINEEPQNYYFTIDEINVSKLQYVENLGDIFNCDLTLDIVRNYTLLSNVIRNWYVSLPKLTRQMIGNDTKISNKKYKMLRKQLTKQSLNSSEFILFTLPKILGTNDLEQVAKNLSRLKNDLDGFYTEFIKELKNKINLKLGFKSETVLTQSLNYWISKNETVMSSKVLEDSVKDFIAVCQNSLNDNEESVINKIAFCLTGFFVEDWSPDTIEVFDSQLEKIYMLSIDDTLQNSGKQNTLTLNIDGQVITKQFDSELDDSIELVENFIESTIEDYGDLLTNEQKLSLLVKIMKKYL